MSFNIKNSQNPLLSYSEFVPYQSFKTEDIDEAVLISIEKARQELEDILGILNSARENPEILNFNNTLYRLIELDEIIERVWNPVENLLSLMGTDDLRNIANKNRPLVIDFYNDYLMDPRVYELVKLYSNTQEAKNLVGERARQLRNTLIDFKLSGAELEGEQKEEFKELNLKLADLAQKFSENSTDSKFELILTKDEDLSGLPQDIIDQARATADEFREDLALKTSEQEALAKIPQGACLFNLDYPSYGPFMKFSDSGHYRKILYIEYLNQGTANASKGILELNQQADLNNENNIKEIFRAKLRKAKLLGFKNYAQLSIETKMAPSPEAVRSFLERLAQKVRPLAEQEYQELVSFQNEIGYINTENNPNKVYSWDKDYLSEKLRKARYDFDTNTTKEYFELNNTIEGMFNLARTLFGIDFRQAPEIEAWHSDVTVYQVLDSDSSLIGTFYMDLYPRDIKRQGAWVMPLRASCKNSDGSQSKSQCALVCNLPKPSPERKSLLSHVEVVTLFHEFGHALHHLLSRVELEPLSGTSVEWDFVELPSQLNENFCWEKESLKTFAKHFQTGESIPDGLIEKMLRARNFNEGLACIRQNEFGLFDLAFYTREIDDDKTALDIYKQIVREFGIFDVWDDTNFPCGFSHIFAGGYAAGYYSYKWAEVLEADAFSRFQQEGILNSTVGMDYRKNILEKGDSKPPMELFVDFMGREPDENALLKRMGLKEVVA
jgi:Zn-dependent oligopeptidase